MCFCNEREVDPFSPNVNIILEFLASLYRKGLGYSAINTARSALSSFFGTCELEVSIGKHYLVKRFMRGIFLLRPSLPRYQFTWDVNKVLTYLQQFSLTADLKILTMKVVMLLSLLAAQRTQTLHLIDVRQITFTDNGVKIRISALIKQSRPGYHLPELSFEKYPDKSLCVVSFLKQYISITEPFRGNETALFLSYLSPHKAVTKDTIARWIKTVMNNAGIDINIFRAHSVRSASVSHASKCRVPLDTILRTAGWSRESTFRKYYDKPITNDTVFAEAVLNNSKCYHGSRN